MNYGRIFAYFFVSAFRSMRNEWKVSALTVFSVSVIGFLFFSIFIVLKQVQVAFYRFGEQTNVIIFLDQENEADTKSRILNETCRLYGVQSCVYRSADMAEAIFLKDYPELDAVVRQLKGKPFLSSIQLFFEPVENQVQVVERISATLKNMPGVASVENIAAQIFAWSKYFGAFQTFFWGFGIVVGLSTLYLLFGAISMTVHRHRIEIEILSLVGARRLWISMPYVIQGILQTLTGLLLTLFVLSTISGYVNDFFEMEFGLKAMKHMRLFSWVDISWILLCAAVLAGIGSLLAVYRYLKDL